MDNELFTLCKHLYERTGWAPNSPGWYRESDVVTTGSDGPFIQSYKVRETMPLYTSDYLLEKLPGNITVAVLKDVVHHREGEKRWITNRYSAHNLGSLTSNWQDTPLKALLKLTIALLDAGEVEEEERG